MTTSRHGAPGAPGAYGVPGALGAGAHTPGAAR